LKGPVVKLERLEVAAVGKITVLGLFDERQVRVVFETTDPTYRLAIQTHEQGKLLRGTGTLTKQGRGFVMHELRDVSIGDE